MATLTIRDFDDDLKAALRVRAAQHGRSMESEVREILELHVKIEGLLTEDFRTRFCRLMRRRRLTTRKSSPPENVVDARSVWRTRRLQQSAVTGTPDSRPAMSMTSSTPVSTR